MILPVWQSVSMLASRLHSPGIFLRRRRKAPCCRCSDEHGSREGIHHQTLSQSLSVDVGVFYTSVSKRWTVRRHMRQPILIYLPTRASASTAGRVCSANDEQSISTGRRRRGSMARSPPVRSRSRIGLAVVSQRLWPRRAGRRNTNTEPTLSADLAQSTQRRSVPASLGQPLRVIGCAIIARPRTHR